MPDSILSPVMNKTVKKICIKTDDVNYFEFLEVLTMITYTCRWREARKGPCSWGRFSAKDQFFPKLKYILVFSRQICLGQRFLNYKTFGWQKVLWKRVVSLSLHTITLLIRKFVLFWWKIYKYREKIIVYLRSKEESHGGATEVGCSPTFVRWCLETQTSSLSGFSQSQKDGDLREIISTMGGMPVSGAWGPVVDEGWMGW